MLRVVGLLLLLLGGLLGVPRVGLTGWGGAWISSLSRGPLELHVGHVVLAVRIGIVAHRHLEVSARRRQHKESNGFHPKEHFGNYGYYWLSYCEE